MSETIGSAAVVAELLGIRRNAWHRIQSIREKLMTSDVRRGMLLLAARQRDRPFPILFVHIPKNAGRSIKATAPTFAPLGGHFEALRLRQAAPQVFERSLVFAVVRDPVDRFVSAFAFLRVGGLHENDRRWADAHLGNLDSPGALIEQMRSSGLYRARIVSFPHFRPQYEYVCDLSNRIIADQLLHFESLDEDWRAMAGKLNIELAELPRLNRSPRSFAPLSRDDEDFVRDIYHRDCSIFGYRLPEAE